jgi:oxaloacetate decarboxylase gamma subunit
MDSTLISQGLDLMLYGMGTVFTFLTLLVGVTTLMSVVVNKLVVEQPEIALSTGVTAPVQSSVEPRIAKVIQAAIDQHRSKK